MRQQLPILFILFCSVIFGCQEQDVPQTQFSGYDYRMDGSRLVPDVGVPDKVSRVTIGYSGSLSSLIFFPSAESNYLIAGGNQIFSGNESGSKIFAKTSGKGELTNILSDQNGVYAIHSSGTIEAFGMDGKLRWQHQDTLTGNYSRSILAGDKLIVSSSTDLEAYNTGDGKKIWTYQTQSGSWQSVIFDPKKKLIIAALSFWKSEGDSIICFDSDGSVKSKSGFAHQRIISNLCLCGKEHDHIAFGAEIKSTTDAMRTLDVLVYNEIQSGHPKKISDHQLPYLPVNIASNGMTVLSSGFYDYGNELTSGIDAFYADDTLKLWQRRFTYPVIAPVAISEKFAYFTLSFSTQAEVPAQSIFYTLDVSTGKALGEITITGAHDGFSGGMPMPIGKNGFMLAERKKPVIYFLKP